MGYSYYLYLSQFYERKEFIFICTSQNLLRLILLNYCIDDFNVCICMCVLWVYAIMCMNRLYSLLIFLLEYTFFLLIYEIILWRSFFSHNQFYHTGIFNFYVSKPDFFWFKKIHLCLERQIQEYLTTFFSSSFVCSIFLFLNFFEIYLCICIMTLT